MHINTDEWVKSRTGLHVFHIQAQNLRQTDRPGFRLFAVIHPSRLILQTEMASTGKFQVTMKDLEANSIRFCRCCVYPRFISIWPLTPIFCTWTSYFSETSQRLSPHTFLCCLHLHCESVKYSFKERRILKKLVKKNTPHVHRCWFWWAIYGCYTAVGIACLCFFS